MYTPSLAIVGRPNVGKSTIFNRCTRSRDALVADVPGLTRDRQYGLWESSLGTLIVIDTAGVTAYAEGVDEVMRQQSRLAMEEADALLFVVDGRSGITPDDLEFLEVLRRREQPVLLVVNKVDGGDQDAILAEYFSFGLPMIGVSAAHSRGFYQLGETIIGMLPEDKRPEAPIIEDEIDEDEFAEHFPSEEPEESEETCSNDEQGEESPEESPEECIVLDPEVQAEIDTQALDSNVLMNAMWQKRLKLSATDDADVVRVAIIGRPNVGKSTLVNRLIGEDRVAVYDMPGTTRDAIAVPFTKHGQEYVLIDTAGVRRRGKVNEAVEKFSIVKTLQAVEMAHVVVCVIDASEGLVDQDLHMLTHALRSGRSVVLAVNKWDGLDDDKKRQVKTALDRKLTFAPYIGIQTMSALHGTGVGHLFEWVAEAFKGAQCRTTPNKLTALIAEAVEAHQPPAVRGRRIKMRFAHWGGVFPPTLVIHGNQLKSLPDTYVRYLENFVRERLAIRGTPIKIELRVGANPFAGKKNKLTERQVKRKKRLMKHVKGR